MPSPLAAPRSATWKWTVCGLLFLATLLNYMDRQALAVTSHTITKELTLTEDHYGSLELAFGLAFAAGGLLFGLLADRVNVWLLYPIVLVGWSVAGFCTGFSTPIGHALTPFVGDRLFLLLGLPALLPESTPTYIGLFFCRVVLGLFEAGQWPCALVTTKRLLTSQDRTLGNSLLQSGASIGAILTPVAVWLLVRQHVAGDWTRLFVAVGAVGLLWLVPWFLLVRPADLAYQEPPRSSEQLPFSLPMNLIRKYLAVAATVILINLTWHFLRAWMPKFLEGYHGISRDFMLWFTVAYYVMTDLGCLGVGFVVKRTTALGWPVHSGRMLAFFTCSLFTLAAVAAGRVTPPPKPAAVANAVQSAADSSAPGNASTQNPAPVVSVKETIAKHWWLLLLLLIVGAGSLGLFPVYYSLSQDLSARNQGKVTGSLSCLTWICTALMQKWVGKTVEVSQSYDRAFLVAGLAPLVAGVLIWLLWPRDVQN